MSSEDNWAMTAPQWIDENPVIKVSNEIIQGMKDMYAKTTPGFVELGKRNLATHQWAAIIRKVFEKVAWAPRALFVARGESEARFGFGVPPLDPQWNAINPQDIDGTIQEMTNVWSGCYEMERVNKDFSKINWNSSTVASEVSAFRLKYPTLKESIWVQPTYGGIAARLFAPPDGNPHVLWHNVPVQYISRFFKDMQSFGRRLQSDRRHELKYSSNF